MQRISSDIVMATAGVLGSWATADQLIAAIDITKQTSATGAAYYERAKPKGAHADVSHK